MNISSRDQGRCWHPYAPLSGPKLPAVLAAQGAELEIEHPSGQRQTVIDAMASWWCQIHGYRNPVLDQALSSQAGKMAHVMFGGLTHSPAVTLAEKLVQLLPEPLQHVFFADSGSIAMEVALKMALQYQLGQGKPQRRQVAALVGAYHGDTFATMSIGDPENSLHASFPGLIPAQVFLPRPPQATWDPNQDQLKVDPQQLAAWENETAQVLEQTQAKVAAIIVEPLLQGAGGMYPWPSECLQFLAEQARHYDLLLVADEIATGFGRTGTSFATARAQVVPDVIAVGKALTGGYLTLAATITTTKVAEVISASPLAAIMHGPTFMANPLACAVATASVDLFCANYLGPNNEVPVSKQIGQQLDPLLREVADLPAVANVRTFAGIGVIEMRERVHMQEATAVGFAHGVWLRPFGKLIYTMPPYICTSAQLTQIAAAMTAIARREQELAQ